ncbi:acetolactate decarboxylase [Histomonas meleagridis]|uniref:acetolactate decarboxylase n=1 Tax=Histomonas meleagridis TaxID=135588 RepID=UPI00355A6BEB|nr:acetolactate decarboxylase [Histomonas meleagridis]KAH0804783.1 acetolactate decarboxylase [Histomonas meleagridis]
MMGNFDRMSSLANLPKECNFGLGCFENLDGEMILIDGKYYQLKADGIAYIPAGDAGTPFATISNFQSTKEFTISKQMSFEEFITFMNSEIPDENVPLLIRFDGEFDFVHYRSVPAQKRPFPTLASVAKSQPEFKKEHMKGSLIGFRFPKYFAGINIPGYHVHVIDDERKNGGHVLGFTIASGKIQTSLSQEFHMHLPAEVESFRKADFTVDLSADTKAVEGPLNK